ncbi:hypothetical protein HDV06_003224, partial [Boothiomyces sp. JEL0866]
MSYENQFGINNLKSVEKSDWSDILYQYLTIFNTRDFQEKTAIRLSFGGGDLSLTLAVNNRASVSEMHTAFPSIVGPILKELEYSATLSGEQNENLELFVSQICLYSILKVSTNIPGPATLEAVEGTFVSTGENYIEHVKKYFQIAKLIAYKMSQSDRRDQALNRKIVDELIQNRLEITTSELELPVMIGAQNLQNSTTIINDMVSEALQSSLSCFISVRIDNRDYPVSLETLPDVCRLINPISLFEFKKIIDFGTGPTIKVNYSRAHDAFEDCARNDPDCVAVEDEDKHITYGELDRRADCVAAGLIKRGLQVGDFV